LLAAQDDPSLVHAACERPYGGADGL
jgi:hypothetical protein